MKARSLFLVVTLLITAGGIAAAPTATRYPLVVKDDAGTAVTLRAAPRRIISLTLASDEMLLSLVDGARMVGVTTYAADPGVSNVAARVAASRPAGLMTLTLNVETIVSLKPDLVIVANWSDAGAVKLLRDAGLTVYLMASGLTVASIEATIARLGLMTDTQDRAASIITDMEKRLAATARRVAAVAPAARVRVMDYAPWGSAQGRGSSWDEIIRRAGLTDAVGDATADEWGQVPLSREGLLKIDPDMLILPGWIDGDPQGSTAFLKDITGSPGLQGLSAVRNGRVLVMPETLKSTTSQYIADAVEWLARAAYPTL